MTNRAGQRAADRREYVLREDDQQPDRANRNRRKPDQAGEQDHAPAEHPDHAGEIVVRKIEVERPRDANHCQLEENEYDAASNEEACECTAVAELLRVEKRTGAGEEGEARRDEVRDPAGEEDAGRQSARGNARVHADVIDRHQNHDDAARHVERCEPTGARRTVHARVKGRVDRLTCRRAHDRTSDENVRYHGSAGGAEQIRGG